MKLASVEAIVRALNEAGVRFLVAGGLAVNAYGYLRFTKDADVILDLDPANVRRAFDALGREGYRPTVPISAEGFADPVMRESWIREKHMRVLQFWSADHRETPIDVFVEQPFDFEEEYSRGLVKDLAGAGPVRFVALRTLIQMKEAAARTEDRIDVEYLKMLLQDHDKNS